MHIRNRATLPKLTSLLLAATIAMQGCGDNTSGGDDGSIALSLSPAAATVQVGGSTAVTGTLTRTSFTGAVTITVEGAPTGVTGAVTTAPTITNPTAVVTITAGSSATPGTYTLTVRAKGSGVTDATAHFTLTVVAATNSSYTFTLGTPTLTIANGASGVTGLAFTRNSFTGNVALSVDNLPVGVSASFNPTAASGNTDTLTLTVSSSATPGTYTVIVRGTANGLTDFTAPLTLTIPASGNFTLSGNAIAGVALGGTATTGTITATRTGGFNGAITYTVTGAPTGLNAAITTTGNGDVGTLTLTPTTGLVAGTYPLVIHATAPGLPEQTFTINVVASVAGTSGFTIAAGSPAVSVAQGASVGGFVKATRTGGFGGTITYTVTGAPTGLTVTATPTTVLDSIALSVAASSSLATGVYPLVIRANATGMAEQTTPLNVTVTSAGGAGSVRLDYSTCAAAARPVWVAFQDGNGAWTRVTGTGDVYTFNIAQAKGSIAVTTQTGATFSTAVQNLTQAEAAAFTGRCATTGSSTVTGSVSNTAALDRSTISLGGSTAFIINPVTAFTLNSVANGTFDLVASRQNSGTPGTNDRMLLRRDVVVNGNGTVGAVLDFTGAESFAPANATLTVTGVAGGETVTPATFYATGAACTLNSYFLGSNISAGANAFTIEGVPAAQQRATDYHVINVSATTAGGATRSVFLSNHTLASRSVALGAALNAATVTTVGASGYKRLQVTTALPADYAGGTLTYSDAAGNTVTNTTTAGFLGGSGFTLTTPDFTGTTGFLTSWFPTTGAAVNWTLTATSPLSTALCTEGATLKSASVNGTNP